MFSKKCHERVKEFGHIIVSSFALNCFQRLSDDTSRQRAIVKLTKRTVDYLLAINNSKI